MSVIQILIEFSVVAVAVLAGAVLARGTIARLHAAGLAPAAEIDEAHPVPLVKPGWPDDDPAPALFDEWAAERASQLHTALAELQTCPEGVAS